MRGHSLKQDILFTCGGAAAGLFILADCDGMAYKHVGSKLKGLQEKVS